MSGRILQRKAKNIFFVTKEGVAFNSGTLGRWIKHWWLKATGQNISATQVRKMGWSETMDLPVEEQACVQAVMTHHRATGLLPNQQKDNPGCTWCGSTKKEAPDCWLDCHSPTWRNRDPSWFHIKRQRISSVITIRLDRRSVDWYWPTFRRHSSYQCCTNLHHRKKSNERKS